MNAATYELRPIGLTLQEAQALADVERQSVHDSPYTAAQMLAVLQRVEQHTYAAFAEGRMVGFCACLDTQDRAGRRLEIDLLGVLPEHRGQGIATRLIGLALEQARMRGTRTARALVALDNVKSRRAFLRAGLTPSGPPVTMLIYEILGNSPQPARSAGWRLASTPCASAAEQADNEVLPGLQEHALYDPSGRCVAQADTLLVHTLAYKGLWIEGLEAQSVRAKRALARALVEWAKREDLDEVSYLHPPQLAAQDEGAPLFREGFQQSGEYQVFVERLA
jgi:ribosomal protein S18 acetylase RimI-like enzyme